MLRAFFLPLPLMTTLLTHPHSVVVFQSLDYFFGLDVPAFPGLSCKANGGQGGIRTHGGREAPTVFKTVPL